VDRSVDKFCGRDPTGRPYVARRVPLYQAWYRARLAWIFNDRVYPFVAARSAWSPRIGRHAINAASTLPDEYVETD